jgi:hypothetical protein
MFCCEPSNIPDADTGSSSFAAKDQYDVKYFPPVVTNTSVPEVMMMLETRHPNRDFQATDTHPKTLKTSVPEVVVMLETKHQNRDFQATDTHPKH